MADQKKFLDYEGVKYLWSKVNMQDYPNNELLVNIINAIDETKANKNDTQKKITGTPGQFVIIGDDGNITTKTIVNAEEASF